MNGRHVLCLVSLLVALAAACSSGGAAVPDPAAALQSRPTLPQVVQTYQRMLDDVRTELTPLVGADGWSTVPPSTQNALCQDFGPQYDTGVQFLPSLTNARFVPEPQWTQVLATIERVTGRYGFNPPVRVVDRPDEHRLALDDRYGAELTVQDGPRFLDLTMRTGCHLRNGRPGVQ